MDFAIYNRELNATKMEFAEQMMILLFYTTEC
jgi:hypothetical protein